MKNEKSKVTPWEVSGKIDYEKLVKEFGLKPMGKLPKEFEKDVLFRRGTIFAHRDFGRIVEAIQKKKKFAMMTGLMPTGKFHIGHMLVAQQMIFYQKLGADIYIAVADIEAYHSRGQSLEESRKIALEEYVANYAALGLNVKKADIYFQSDRSKDGKKAGAYYRLQNLLARHVTFNEFKAVYGDISPGKIISSLLQASDMLHPMLKEFSGNVPTIIPVGVDQDPHIRIARDMARRFKLGQLSSTYHMLVPGLKKGKMSSSDEMSFIALSDSAKEVETKIKKYAFSGGKDTLEEHRKKGGNTDVDVSFQYLKFFFEDSDKKLEKIKKDYESGKLLTGELKKIAIDKINSFLKSHQVKLAKARKEVEKMF
jgi:tryptophanyl-tRNA synthetase